MVLVGAALSTRETMQAGPAAANNLAAAPPAPMLGALREAEAAPSRRLVVAPVVYMHGGHMGEPTADLSAGRSAFVHGVDAVTHRNMVLRLFFNSPDVANRLIHVGCLPGCADAASFGGSILHAAVQPEGVQPHRSPAQLAADREAYSLLVAIAQHAELYRLTKVNLQELIVQGLQLLDGGQHAVVGNIAIELNNAWALQTVSGANSGKKTTMRDYMAPIARFCEFLSRPQSPR